MRGTAKRMACAGIAAIALDASAAAPKDSTLTLAYTPGVVDAVFSLKPAERAEALERETRGMEALDHGTLVEADFRLLRAHLLQDLKKPREAAEQFAEANNRLDQATFLPDRIETELGEPSYEATAGFTGARSAARRWLSLRRVWIELAELGLSQGDKAALEKGRRLLETIAGPGVSRRPWLVPRETRRQAGGVAITVEAWHPDRTDSALQYALPFLMKLQNFKVTIENRGGSPVEFSSDDATLTAAGGKRVAALAVDDLTARTLTDGAPLQQFIFPELLPYTFSNLPSTTYDGELTMRAADAARERENAEVEAAIERANAQRAEIAALGATLGQAALNTSHSIREIDIRQERDKAEEARRGGLYATARRLETEADWDENDIKQQRENEKAWGNSAAASVAGHQAAAEDAEAQAGAATAANPDIGNIRRALELEAGICRRLASKKLERFLNSNLVLPHRGTRLRIMPGKSWTGFLSFPADTAEGATALRLRLRGGAGAVAHSFALQTRKTEVIQPPQLTYAPETTGWTEMGTAWEVLLPRLRYPQ